MAINFFSEDISFTLSKRRIIKKWIRHVISNKDYVVGDINYIFTSNNNILAVNQQYLNHNYFTDIITFDYRDNKRVSCDIYISIETVKENSGLYNVSFDNELYRVIIHGILHLIGYNDSSDEEKNVMRNAENQCLEMLNSNFL